MFGNWPNIKRNTPLLHIPSKKIVKNLTIYVWPPNKDSTDMDMDFGHASMQLSDGIYISWWPDISGNTWWNLFYDFIFLHCLLFYPIVRDLPPQLNRTYEDDNEACKSQPQTITFTNINQDQEAKIKAWWKEFSKKNYYNWVSRNCSTVVILALCQSVGGLKHYLELPSTSVWTPSQLAEKIQLVVLLVDSVIKFVALQVIFLSF